MVDIYMVIMHTYNLIISYYIALYCIILKNHEFYKL